MKNEMIFVKKNVRRLSVSIEDMDVNTNEAISVKTSPRTRNVINFFHSKFVELACSVSLSIGDEFIFLNLIIFCFLAKVKSQYSDCGAVSYLQYAIIQYTRHLHNHCKVSVYSLNVFV